MRQAAARPPSATHDHTNARRPLFPPVRTRSCIPCLREVLGELTAPARHRDTTGYPPLNHPRVGLRRGTTVSPLAVLELSALTGVGVTGQKWREEVGNVFDNRREFGRTAAIASVALMLTGAPASAQGLFDMLFGGAPRAPRGTPRHRTALTP